MFFATEITLTAGPDLLAGAGPGAIGKFLELGNGDRLLLVCIGQRVAGGRWFLMICWATKRV